MTDIRFITKTGTSVDIATVRKRFFDSVAHAGIYPDSAGAVWSDAILHGNVRARALIEQLCEISLVDSDTGFGFRE